jgi:chromosome segregation ATPase
MSVEFTNTYQEILLDNLVAIIKQNFVFQTQIKLAENTGQQKEELEKQLNELKNQMTSFNYVTEQLEMYKNKVDQNSSAHEEKSRIQSALNEEMKKSSSYKEEIDKKNADIIKLSNEMKVIKEELETLKELVPVSKLKKLDKPKPVEVVKKEEPKIQKFIKPVDIKPLKVESGGTF